MMERIAEFLTEHPGWVMMTGATICFGTAMLIMHGVAPALAVIGVMLVVGAIATTFPN